MTVVIGNLYKIEKKKVPIGRINKLKARVSIADTQATNNPEVEESKNGGASANNYHVAGLGEENATMVAVTANNLRLLPSDASLDNIESRMTSVSLGAANSKNSL